MPGPKVINLRSETPGMDAFEKNFNELKKLEKDNVLKSAIIIYEVEGSVFYNTYADPSLVELLGLMEYVKMCIHSHSVVIKTQEEALLENPD